MHLHVVETFEAEIKIYASKLIKKLYISTHSEKSGSEFRYFNYIWLYTVGQKSANLYSENTQLVRNRQKHANVIIVWLLTCLSWKIKSKYFSHNAINRVQKILYVHSQNNFDQQIDQLATKNKRLLYIYNEGV